MALRRIAVAAISLLCGLECASAAPRWLKLNSANFELFTTAGERRGRDAILYFEQVRSFFLKATHSSGRSALPVRIVAFSSDKEYKPYRASEAAAAYAMSGHDRDYIVLSGTGSENYPVAVHEYVHLLMKPAGDKVPLWLNEGLAELYSTLKPVGKRVQVGDILPGRLLVLQQSKWLNLETLIAIDHNSPYYNEKSRASVFYAEAWALTHMLMLTEPYRTKLPQFLVAAANGDQKAAFEQAFGKKIWEVWMDLQAYLRRNSFNIAVFHVELEKSAEQPEIREATALESGLVLANLLVAVRKRDEARQAFAELARQNPLRPEVEEAFGYFALSDRETAEASTHFARAVELGSANAKFYYDYATLLHQSGERHAEGIPLLRRAVELDPGFTKARYYLGLRLLAERNYEEAVKHLSQVKRMDREEAYPLFQALAHAYHQLGNQAEAITAAERAKKFARNPDETAAAERMLEFLKQPPRPAPVVAQTQKPAEEAEKVHPAPRLVRRPEAPRTPPTVKWPPQPAGSSIEGTLEQVDCLGKRARLRLRFAGRQVRLAILDPTRVMVTGAGSGKVEFNCGPQKPRQVTIVYDPKVDGELGTIGIVKTMEFK